MEETISKWERFSFGLLLPTLSLIAGLMFAMALESGAAAAEFSSLGIMLISIIAMPIYLIVNGIVAFMPAPTRLHCYGRGMWLPGFMIVVAVLYQIGVVDSFF